MLPGMSAVTGRTPEAKRRSFAILMITLVVIAIAVAFVISRGGDDGAAVSPTPSTSTSTSAGAVTLETACGQVAPDMPLRVDALRRTAEAVRADIAAMESQGNSADAEQATLLAEALENMAVAQEDQEGVQEATAALGETLATIC